MADRVLVVLDPAGSREVDTAALVVSATDLGVTRGDGVFEVFGVRVEDDGDVRLHAADAHLRRLGRSARMLDMPAPDTAAFADAARRAAAGLGLAPGDEGAVKIVHTRGPEAALDAGAPQPTGWAYAWRLPDMTAMRRDGITVATISRGYARGQADTAPWLLIGAKTLSYAVNRAAEREARRRGVDEVLFTTSDGHVLEGPTWTFAARIDGVVVTVPIETGVLPGTTQADAFAWLDAQGVPTAVRDIGVDELATADAAWSLSSTELAAPIRELDGRPVPVDAGLTARLNEALAARRE